MEDKSYYIQKFKEIYRKDSGEILSDEEASYLFECLTCLTAQVFARVDIKELLKEFKK